MNSFRAFVITLIVIMTFLGTFVAGMILGQVTQQLKAFPYSYIKKASTLYVKWHRDDYGPWSIGIFTGPTPFALTDPKSVKNPVLTGEDVDDIDAEFVADPFIVLENDQYYMFFEVLNRDTSRGVIGYAKSRDGKQWDYQGIILEEDFHLSYPYTFKWENDHYMIPESHNDFSVRLYKATNFPDKFEYVETLLSGHPYTDPSIFRHQDKWWLFASNPENNALNLYFSNDLEKGWKPHPMNPIVKKNNHISRPGGRVFVYDDRIYRLTQDDGPRYGIQVFALEITELSETAYQEKLVEKPLVRMTGEGWNATGMHTVDPHKINNKWVSAVDGSKWPE